MRATTSLITLSAATLAVGQGLNLPPYLQGLSFSTQCQAALLGALSSGPISQCLPLAPIIPALTSSASVVPALDDFMSQLCYSQPCSNETLNTASQAILNGCAADLQAGGFPNATVSGAFSLYPLVREILCLKTTDPYTAESYGGFLGEPAIPITEYNSTDGYFCVSSFLTQLSAYYDSNITVPFVTSIINGSNQQAIDLSLAIQPNIVCNECIFGALDILNLATPVVGNTPVDTVAGLLNLTLPTNQTVNELVNEECAYIPLEVSTNGTLPDGVSVSIVNSTFPFQVTNGDM